MKQVDGIWLPDHEQHFPEWWNTPSNKHFVDGKATYQWKKIEAVLSHVRCWGVALDIGGHCGLWSMHLTKRFNFVHAFEPVAEHRECFVKNVEGAYELHPCALGDVAGKVRIEVPHTSSGGSHLTNSAHAKPGSVTEEVPILRLDSIPIEGMVGLIKIDVEGFETAAIRGGEKTIRRHKPVMIVEQKGMETSFGFKPQEAVHLLESWGAKQLQKPMSGDYILGWV